MVFRGLKDKQPNSLGITYFRREKGGGHGIFHEQVTCSGTTLLWPQALKIADV